MDFATKTIPPTTHHVIITGDGVLGSSGLPRSKGPHIKSIMGMIRQVAPSNMYDTSHNVVHTIADVYEDRVEVTKYIESVSGLEWVSMDLTSGG